MSKADSPTKLCTESDCDRSLRARGLCATHYNQRHQPNRHRKVTVTCEACGAQHQASRTDGRYCSLLCRDFQRWGTRQSLLPAAHPARTSPLPVGHPVTALLASRTPVERDGKCGWCGASYRTRRLEQRFCSNPCKVRAKHVRRRAAEHGASGGFTWVEVIRIFLAFNRCCAYCRQPVVGQPDPDHVVPLSRGGGNGIANILPSCRACNSDKRDLLLPEWVMDRARRLLPPVVTDWSSEDRRYWHLTSVVVNHAA